MSHYEAVIGLEVHIQVRTASKMFCSCPNKAGAEPNTLVCPVCLGYPGALPVPNQEAIRKTVIAGLLTECSIARFSKFDRKSYFYPDMAKNYQISQYDLPFCSAGCIHIGGDGVKGFSGDPLPAKDIHITRIHLEEDAAKLNNQHGASGVDYNRAGVPLMETVSEPEIRTPDEAYAYLTTLKEIMQYGEISNCDMEKGEMRCDVNVSLRKSSSDPFGAKIELKNLNSFRAVHRALEYEIWRQAQELDAGHVLRQETRGWNDDTGESYLMRSKEQAHDYRYFPDPDLMPVTFTDAEIEEFERNLPELPKAMRRRFVESFGLTEYDAEVLTGDRHLAAWFEAGTKSVKTPKLLANWIISDLLRELSAAGKDISDSPVGPEALAELVNTVEAGTISGRVGKEVLAEMFASGKRAPEIIKEKGLAQVSDTGAVEGFVDQAIAANPAQVAEFKAGNPKIVQYLVGQVMKLSHGKANPKLVSEMLNKKLQ